MKYFFDTEFLEDGKTIDLISIGIVREDGKEFYAVNEEANWHAIAGDQWLRENVLPHLQVIVTPVNHFHRIDRQPDESWSTRAMIRDDVLAFVGSDQKPEFWAYFASYDWVVFCQLFGRMVDLPSHFPMFCRDLKQWADDLGNPTLPTQESGVHDALSDAQWNRDAWLILDNIAKQQRLV